VPTTGVASAFLLLALVTFLSPKPRVPARGFGV
jgi:hypothetical protein